MIASCFLDCQFLVRSEKSEKWNGFLDLTQLWDPVDDANEERVLWCDVVAEVAVLGGSEDPVQEVCSSVNFLKI